jgi:hypothetical protein
VHAGQLAAVAVLALDELAPEEEDELLSLLPDEESPELELDEVDFEEPERLSVL